MFDKFHYGYFAFDLGEANKFISASEPRVFNEPYFHQNLFAQFFTVNNLDCHFATTPVMNAEFHKALKPSPSWTVRFNRS
jgi:hypothetical protein